MTLYVFVLILIGLLMIPPVTPSQITIGSPADQIDTFIRQQMTEQHLPGLGLAITHGDQTVLIQAYGEDVTMQSQFFIASLSKSFTAVAVMQLVEASKIDLDMPIQSYLPEFALDDSAGARITVRNLLNQTSGLADTGFPESILPQPDSLQERVRSLKTAQIVSEPGTQFHYFNPNYGVLARLVEVVSGEPFADYMQTHVFEPLSMAHTFAATTSDEAIRSADHLASGHVQVYGIPVTMQEMSGFLGGSGGIISTPEDMAHFLIMQNNGGMYKENTVISPESLALMHSAPAGIDSSYAMGWLTDEHNGVRTIEHNGILSVYYADMVLLPDSDYGIVLLYNLDALPATLLSFPAIKNGVIDILSGKAPASGSITTTGYGLIAAMITIVGSLLALRSLIGLPRWIRKRQHAAFVRLLPGIAAGYIPAALLLLLPQLVAFSGRVYSIEQLVRFAPDVYAWLGITGLLGILNSTSRLFLLAQRNGGKLPRL